MKTWKPLLLIPAVYGLIYLALWVYIHWPSTGRVQ